MNNIQTFEKFLEEICFKLNPDILDDDISDFFDNWIGNLNTDQILEWGDLYGMRLFVEGQTKVVEDLKKSIN